MKRVMTKSDRVRAMPLAKSPALRRSGLRPKIGLAIAGGGPLGAMYEIGVLMALDESLRGLKLNDIDVYVGVSAGSLITAGLANNFTPAEIFQLFIEDKVTDVGALRPEVFLRPAFGEYFRRVKMVPPLLARSLLNFAAAKLRHPLTSAAMESFAPLARALPTGIFENDAIRVFLEKTFNQHGRTDDFRRLKHRLYSVATDLDTGESVCFGGPGFDDVPISKAVQASAALPGLFPPVEINGHFYVDGALKKTVNASLAMDAGAELVFCINPLVPFNADAARRKGKPHMGKLIEGGLLTVLSQTFRAIIHSRMQVGMKKYETQYKGRDLVLFEPSSDDGKIFFTNLFSYASRKMVCEHAYQRTRIDLLKRRHELAPVLAKYGITLNLDRLKDEKRTLNSTLFALGPNEPKGARLAEATVDLGDTLGELEKFVARSSR